MVLIRIINDFLDSSLNDQLGALVAGKKGNINATALNVCSILIQNGIQFSMAN